MRSMIALGSAGQDRPLERRGQLVAALPGPTVACRRSGGGVLSTFVRSRRSSQTVASLAHLAPSRVSARCCARGPFS